MNYTIYEIFNVKTGELIASGEYSMASNFLRDYGYMLDRDLEHLEDYIIYKDGEPWGKFKPSYKCVGLYN